MEDWAKGIGVVIVFAAMSAIAFKIGAVESTGEAFAVLCIAGIISFLLSTAHRWESFIG